MSQVPKILIVCQSGVGVGLGHLKRSIVVANSLKEAVQAEIRLIVHGDEISLENFQGIPCKFLRRNVNLIEQITHYVKAEKVQLVIFDLQLQMIPPNINKMFQDLRGLGCKFIAIDSMYQYAEFLDLIYTPSFRQQGANITKPIKKMLYGWDCFLLDVHGRRCEWSDGKKVLALTGGSDAANLGSAWLLELDAKLPKRAELHWVTGPFALPPVLPKNPRIQIENHVSPSSLNKLMSEVNYSITVYGVSFFELLYYGVPTVVFSPYSGKDNLDLDEIEALGVALVARDEHDAINQLNLLMDDEKLAKSLSIKGMELIASNGKKRFSEAALSVVNSPT